MSLLQTYLEKVQNNYDEGIIDSIKNLGKKFLKLVGFEETKFDYWFFDILARDLKMDVSMDKIVYKKLVTEILTYLKSKNIKPTFVAFGPFNGGDEIAIDLNKWQKRYANFRIGNPKGISKLGIYKNYEEDLKRIFIKYKFKNLQLQSYDFRRFVDVKYSLRLRGIK